MIKPPNYLLSNGKQIPMIGLGTWRSPANVLKDAVKDAIDIGYRHFDCAYIYQNEAEVGKAIAEKIEDGTVKREELFITGKLWNTYHKPALVRDACEKSLKALGLNYLDLYLMHWPMAYKSGEDLYPVCPDTGKAIFEYTDYMDTWRAMEDLVVAGLVQSIGISNFNIEQFKRLLKESRIKPVILQFESHPYLRQQKLKNICYEYGVAVTAYSSLGSGHTPYDKPGTHKILEHPCILELAKKYNREPAQILLRYQTQCGHGHIVIPRSISKDHLISNFNIWDFKLSRDDLRAIDDLDCKGRFMTMSGAIGHPYYPFEDELLIINNR